MLNELFTANETTNTANSRSLPGTAELTSLSGRLANGIVQTMNDNASEYAARIKMSTVDASELDKLIVELIDDYGDAADFLKDLDDALIDSMLKSQQSKRSRCKSKKMTLDNYMAYMSAAIAEKLIRDITGRAKTAGHRGMRASVVDYTAEELQQLKEDQERLRRELRNIQSKKSIMKSKADFDESDDRWLALLKAESQLKGMRVGTNRVVEVDKTKNMLTEKLADVDISKLNSKDAHELLASISEMISE